MGLLTDNVSARVIEKARRERTYLEDLETVSGVRGSLNIELLISLIESAKIHDWTLRRASSNNWCNAIFKRYQSLLSSDDFIYSRHLA